MSTTQFRSSHTHKQESAADTWTIPHGLNCKPSVTVLVVYEDVLQPILPNQISYTDDSTVVISFTQPFVGEARLI